jgi:hypothetical protein
MIPSQHGLLVVPPPALTARHSHLSYMRGAVVSPVCISAAVFAACIGFGLLGPVGAVVALVASVTLGASATRYRWVRRHLDRQAAHDARCQREAHRLRQLRPTGPVRQQQYVDLLELVEQIEHSDPLEAARFELQDLLEHFVRISIAQQRCANSLRLTGCGLQAIPIEASRRKREILARRLAHRDQCVKRIERLTEELEAIDELIRLVAQRVACPTLDLEFDREIDRRLWELDEVDAALKQLSA